MRLAEFLVDRNIKPADFGGQIGVSYESVRRYCTGERIPDREVMTRIFGATNGAVTANDFFYSGSIDRQAPEAAR